MSGRPWPRGLDLALSAEGGIALRARESGEERLHERGSSSRGKGGGNRWANCTQRGADLAQSWKLLAADTLMFSSSSTLLPY